MATISSPGVGSGLDVDAIVKQLVSIERRPINLITEQKTTLQSKLSAFGLIKSYTVNVQDAVAKLADASLWTKTKALTTDTSLTVSSTAAAVKGSYNIGITQLAEAHALASQAYTSSTDPVGSGKLTIELGTWTSGPATFTPKSGSTAVEVTIEPGQDSLEQVRSAINAANAGVTASIVRDASGARLAITSNATGADNAIRITAAADAPAQPGDPTLDDLVYNPEVGPGNVTQTIEARNATATVNGLNVTSTTNTFDNVIEGVKFTASKVTTTPATVAVSLDTDTMKSAVNTFISAYNDIAKYINQQTKYDAETKVAGALQGDRSTLSVLSQLRSVVTGASQASSSLRTMSDIGIQLQPDGTLKLNEARFATAMENPEEVAKAFSAKDAINPADNGFAVRMKAMTAAMLSTDGLVSNRADGLRSSITLKDKQIATYEQRVAQTEARLYQQYSALDSKMSTLNALNAYVTQQVTNWNKAKS